jgi:hypothetical protein
MKRIYVCAILLLSCAAASAEDVDVRFVGVWDMVKIVDGEHQIEIPLNDPSLFATWEFRADGSGIVKMGKGDEKKEMVFSWKISDEKLLIIDEKGGTTDTVTFVFEDNGSRLIMNKEDDSSFELVRHKSQ